MLESTFPRIWICPYLLERSEERCVPLFLKLFKFLVIFIYIIFMCTRVSDNYVYVMYRCGTNASNRLLEDQETFLTIGNTSSSRQTNNNSRGTSSQRG
jgi:hypothetical protein